MDNNRKTMNKREIFMGHAYVFLFFFLTTVACCLAIFMWNSDFKIFEQKEFVKIKMNRIKEFQQLGQALQAVHAYCRLLCHVAVRQETAMEHRTKHKPVQSQSGRVRDRLAEKRGRPALGH